MTQSKRPLLIGGLVALLLAVSGWAFGATTASSQPLPFPDGEVSTERLGGETRFETSVEISEYQFPNGSDTVFLARADEFPDALSAAPLTGGPVLLVPQCDELPTVISDEISRLAPTEVIALGGEDAVCDQVLQDAAVAANAGDGTETESEPVPTETETAPQPTETETGLPIPIPTTTDQPTPSESPSPSETPTDPTP